MEKDTIKVILYTALLFVAIAVVGHLIIDAVPAYSFDYWGYKLALVFVFPVWFLGFRTF